MKHLTGISSEQYVYGVNCAWQLYKKLQARFPDRFKEYIADSKFKTRLSYNQNDDRWYLLKVSFPDGIANFNLKNLTHGNPSNKNSRNKYSTGIAI